MDASLCNWPWAVKDINRGICVRFLDQVAADSYATAGNNTHEDRPFVTYDARKPHLAIDTEGNSGSAFEDEERARDYVASNNRYQGRERFLYEFIDLD